MACQTVITDPFLLVAPHAPTHRHVYVRFFWGPFAVPDVPVAGLAGDLPQDRVSPMGVKDVAWLFIDVSPRNLFSFFCKLPDLFFFGTFCDSFLMALQTSCVVWHSREGLGLDVAVAGIARQPLFKMLLMVEGDRLLSFGAKPKTEEEEKQEGPGRQSNEEKFHAEHPWVNTGLSAKIFGTSRMG